MMVITEVGRHAGDQSLRLTVSEILEKSNFVLKSKEITIGILISTYSVKHKKTKISEIANMRKRAPSAKQCH